MHPTTSTTTPESIRFDRREFCVMLAGAGLDTGEVALQPGHAPAGDDDAGGCHGAPSAGRREGGRRGSGRVWGFSCRARMRGRVRPTKRASGRARRARQRRYSVCAKMLCRSMGKRRLAKRSMSWCTPTRGGHRCRRCGGR